MKHSVDELLAIVYHYFPRGHTWEPASNWMATEEARRLVEARKKAGANREQWTALLKRIESRFPGQDVEDRSLHLPTGQYDSAYGGRLYMNEIAPDERYHYLGFFVSFLGPYYIVYSARGTDPGGKTSRHIVDFEFSPVEQPYVDAIKDAIHDTFRDHFPMGSEIGNVLVPEAIVSASSPGLGRCKLYDFLFSEDW